MKANVRIKIAMRENEVSLLAHLRAHEVSGTTFFGRSWSRALDRLEKGGMVKWSRRRYRYVVRKGGRPVTGAVRALVAQGRQPERPAGPRLIMRRSFGTRIARSR